MPVVQPSVRQEVLYTSVPRYVTPVNSGNTWDNDIGSPSSEYAEGELLLLL